MIITGIYKIESNINPGKVYIGSAVDFAGRKRSHLSRLRKNKHHSPKMQSHYNKYGESDLVFSLLCECTPSELINKEQEYIDLHNPWFNICKVAGSSLGVKHSDEYKEKIRKVTTGKKASEDTRRKMSDSQKRIGNKPPNGTGRIKSLETRMKLSIANKGKSPSIETRLKISKTLTGRPGTPHTAETKAKLSLIHKGNIISDEVKKKISDKLKGRKLLEETKKKMSVSRMGRKGWNTGMKGMYSAEALEKMRNASIRYWQSKKKTA